jgi:glycosyltransferase involved in cell wall biosynthesis
LAVQKRSGSNPFVNGPIGIVQSGAARLAAINRRLLRGYQDRKDQLFSPNWSWDYSASLVRSIQPDIVQLSWVARGFVRPESLARYGRPIVWMLHDMWPFTGGCHYDAGCGRFRESCGHCPVLASKDEIDLSRKVWTRKADSWRNLEITVVALSQWIGRCARDSSLFRDARIEVIPNCIDTGFYFPCDRSKARRALGLPEDRQLLLAAADNIESDPRKGFHHLLAALKRLPDPVRQSVDLVVMGARAEVGNDSVPLKVHCLGYLDQDSQKAFAYSAADLLVAPSVQENLANTVMESLACGTPVVAFDIGGMPDMIRHRSTGYLARPADTDDLAIGIDWVLSRLSNSQEAAALARAHVLDQYSPSRVAGQYLSLYQSILTRRN